MRPMGERISRSDVVRAALTLLDDGGFPALAMRRIAAELGVQQSALYWHFANKQTLLAAVADEIVAAVPAPSGDDWRARVRTLAAELRLALLRHRDGAELVATSLAFRLGAGDMVAAFRNELAGAGTARKPVDADAVETAANVLVHFVLGFTTDEQQRQQAAELGAIDADASAAPADSTASFERGVELIIVGFAPSSRRP